MISDQRRDHFAGALVALIGAGAAYKGSTYDIGTLTRMGSGFFPTALGVLMIIMGVLIGAAAPRHTPTVDAHAAVPGHPDWRGWAAIIGGVVLFIGLATYAGLMPATFACVFVAAMGDRQTTWKQAALLAAGITVFGILVFALGLKVQIPILRGMSSWG